MNNNNNTEELVVEQYSPEEPYSFQDTANRINDDFSAGAFTEWKYYEFPYNVPDPDGLRMEEWVSIAAFSLTDQNVKDACDGGTLFNFTWTDTVNKKGRIWVVYWQDLTWPPPEYPQ